MATIQTYVASMRTRKSDESVNFHETHALQGYVQEDAANYCGILNFPEMNLAGKAILSIKFAISALSTGDNKDKTAYFREANYQNVDVQGVTGAEYAGRLLGTLTGKLYNVSGLEFVIEGEMKDALARYFSQGNNTLCLMEENPTSRDNYFHLNRVTVTIEYDGEIGKIAQNADEGEFGRPITFTIDKTIEESTHRLRCLIGDNVVHEVSGFGTDAEVTVPKEAMVHIPDDEKTEVRIECETMIGDAVAGMTECTMTMWVPETTVPFAGSDIITDLNEEVTGKFGGLLQNKSDVHVRIPVYGAYGSRVVRVEVDFDGTTYTATEGQLVDVDGEKGIEFYAGTLKRAGEAARNRLRYEMRLIDSRGRGEGMTILSFTQKPIYAYASPTVSEYEIYRCNAAGEPDMKGKYLMMDLAATASPIVVLAEGQTLNPLTAKVYCKRTVDTRWELLEDFSGLFYPDGSFSVTGHMFVDSSNAMMEFDTLISYEVRVEVGDSFAQIVQTLAVPTKIVVMDHYRNGSGSAIGKISERPKVLEIVWPIVMSESVIPNARANTTTGLVYIGEDVIAGPADDSVAYWVSKGFCYAYMSGARLQEQPTASGFVLSLPRCETTEKVSVKSTNIVQLWLSADMDGHIYKRYGSSLGLFSSWETVKVAPEFDEKLIVRAGMDVTGKATIRDDIEVKGESHFGKDAQFDKDVRFAGDVEFSGEVKGVGERYSEAEYFTGDYWIDGKPLYRRVLTITDDKTGSWSYSIADIEFEYIRIVNNTIKFKYNDNAYTYWASGAWYNEEGNRHRAFIRDKDIRFMTGSGVHRIVEYIVLEYTKPYWEKNGGR